MKKLFAKKIGYASDGIVRACYYATITWAILMFVVLPAAYAAIRRITGWPAGLKGLAGISIYLPQTSGATSKPPNGGQTMEGWARETIEPGKPVA